MRADRLVSLALLLQARRRTSARALAAELEVSVRTVYRDIAALTLAGVPVVTESGPGGGCWLLEGSRFPLRGLSGDEAEALLVLGVPAAVAELGLADALAAAQQKIRVTAGASRSVGAFGASDAHVGAGGGPAAAADRLPARRSRRRPGRGSRRRPGGREQPGGLPARPGEQGRDLVPGGGGRGGPGGARRRALPRPGGLSG